MNKRMKMLIGLLIGSCLLSLTISKGIVNVMIFTVFVIGVSTMVIKVCVEKCLSE